MNTNNKKLATLLAAAGISLAASSASAKPCEKVSKAKNVVPAGGEEDAIAYWEIEADTERNSPQNNHCPRNCAR